MRIKKIGEKIDLGCGKKPKKGYVGIDCQDFGQDIVWDITKGIPLPDNSVDSVYSSHFVEHISEEDISPLMHEIVRVCRVGAKINIICPHADTKEAFYLGHLSRWNKKRVRGIIKGWVDNKDLKLIKVKRVGKELKFKLNVQIKRAK